MSIPRSSPETTIESAIARLWRGARSPTRGSISWGVTVDTAVMKDKARKTENDFVTQRPSHCEALICVPDTWLYTYQCSSEEN